MKHKYLDDIKVKTLFKPRKDDHRLKEWAEERKVYGFDERETWSLRDFFLGWLYEHIKRFLDVCDVDLSYHKFTYKKKEYTQLEILNLILKDIELYFNVDGCFFKEVSNSYSKWWNKQIEYQKEIGTLWGLVLPVMWW